MKLSCALVLALTNLVIATPFSFSVKGSGSSGKVDPTTIPFGTFGIVQPVESKTGYSGSISKPSSLSFAPSSASQSSGSFNYNSAQAGRPSLASNSAGFVAPSQNVAVTPQTFASAEPNIHHVGASVNPTGYSPSKDVNGVSQHADAVSQFQHQVIASEQKPGYYLGSNPHVSVSQDVSKPNVFVYTVSSSNPAVSGSFHSKDVYGVHANSDTVSKFQQQLPTEQQSGIYLDIHSNAHESQGISQSNLFVSTESPAITSVSSSQLPKDVNGAQVSADTTSSFQHGLEEKDRKPDYYLGSNPHTFVSQDIVKPDGFVSSGDSREPERFKEPSTTQNVPSNFYGSVDIVSTVQGQATPTVEKKPIYSSGFGGPPGLLKPYDKVSISGVTNQASNSYQSNQKPSEFVNTKPQVSSYTPVSNENPSYSFQQQQQQQQTGTIKPVQSLSIDYVTPSSQYSYRPEIIPSKTNENKPSDVKDNERPSSEFRPTNDVQLTGDKYANQRPEIESSHNVEFDVEHASHGIKPSYHIIVQAQPGKKPSQTGTQYDTSYVATESAEKLKPTQEPLYTGGFGAPAGVLEPIQGSLSEVHKFASTTVKPEWQDSAKPNVGFIATGTEVNKHSSSFGETYPTQKPSFESTSYQSFDIGSSPASYVTLKPSSSSSSYSEQYIQTSSVSEGQSTPKPFENIPSKPTLSTWTQNPTQAPTYVQKPETTNPAKPVVEISSQNKPIQDSQFVGTFTTTKPHSHYEKFPSSPLPWGYSPSDVSGSVDEAKPNNQQVSSIQQKPSQSSSIVGQIEVQKPFYQPSHTGKPTVNQVSFDKTKPSGSVVITGYKGTATSVPSGLPYQINDKETTSKVSELNSFSANVEPQSQKKPTAVNQNKPYSTSFGTLTGSTGYISSSSNLGQSGFATESNDKVSQSTQTLSTDLHKPTPSSYVVPSNVGTENASVKPGVTSGSTVISQQSSFGGLNRVSSASTSSQKPTYQPLSDSYSVTGSVPQNSDIQKHTDKSPSVQERPSSEHQKFPNQVFTSNSAFSSGFTPFGSKPQYQQQPTIQPGAQKKPWYTNSFGTSVTAKPYNQYPGFSSSFTSFGHGSSVTSGAFDKTKQTTQFISTGQYTPTSSGQYNPYSTGQYKPYNWGVGVQQGVKKFSNVYPTGGYFASTYAPTTLKPFVKPTSFDKSKDSSSFSVTSNKESTYVSGVGSPLSVTTSKPSLFSQTTYKPVSGFSSSGGYSENPTVNTIVVSTTPKYETPKNQQDETRPNESSHLTQNSGLSASAQSSVSSVKPTINLPTHSAQFEVYSEKVNPTNFSPSGSVGYHPNESGFKVEVTKVPESSYTLAPETGKIPVSENKPYSDIYVQSLGTKPSTTFTPQNKIDEKVQFSQTSKPASSYDLIKENPTIGGHFEGASGGLKPTNQPFISTSSYYFNKEVTPTQVSAISQNKADHQVQFSQTSKPDWSSGSNQKESSFVSSLGKTSDDVKPTGQPTLSTSSHSYNKEVTSTQFDAKNPLNYGTITKHTSASLTTGSTGFSNFDLSQKQPSQSVLSSTNLGDYKEHPSSLVPNKPVYSTSVQQPSVQVPFVSGLGDSPKENKQFTANYNTQYNSAGSYQSTSEHLVSPKPQVPVQVPFEKEPGFVVSYKEKDTNQASFISSHAKPTVTYVETDSKYTYGPTQVPQALPSKQTPTVSSVPEAQKFSQVNPTSQANVAYNGGNLGLYDSSKQTNQQSWGFSGNNGAPQSTQASYVGGFGGPTGILKPSDFSKPPQQQYVQTQYKPSYNNPAAWEIQSNPHTSVSSNTASYTGGFGAPAGVLTANENVKPNSYVHNVDKNVSNVQFSGFHPHAGQTGVSQAQVSAGQQSNAPANASAGGFLHGQQTLFNSGSKAFSTGEKYAIATLVG